MLNRLPSADVEAKTSSLLTSIISIDIKASNAFSKSVGISL